MGAIYAARLKSRDQRGWPMVMCGRTNAAGRPCCRHTIGEASPIGGVRTELGVTLGDDGIWRETVPASVDLLEHPKRECFDLAEIAARPVLVECPDGHRSVIGRFIVRELTAATQLTA